VLCFDYHDKQPLLFQFICSLKAPFQNRRRFISQFHSLSPWLGMLAARVGVGAWLAQRTAAENDRGVEEDKEK
jgi:hypothetical protein